MPKRILFAHHVSSIGGGSYCMKSIIKELDRSLFQPLAVLPGEGPLADDLRELGVEVVFFPEMSAIPYNQSLFRTDSLHDYYSVYKSVPKWKALLSELHVDVLYLNNMMLCRYLKPAKKCGCKTVIHVREHWPLNEHRRQLAKAQECVHRYADEVIAINHYSASMFPQKQARIVYDWIDMDNRYKPMPMDEVFGEDMAGKKVFLYMGGVQRIKGAYEVMSTFCNKLTDSSYRLLAMGLTKELSGTGIVKTLKTLMYKLGIPPYEYKVKMLARKDPRVTCIPYMFEMKDIMAQSYCMLSCFTMPHANLSLAEAIVMGLPAIAARTEESEEYSLGGTLASLYEINDTDAFEKAIRSFVSDESTLRAALTPDARRKVAEMFSAERNSAILNKTLSDLV
ncbi:MAG: glycosyltransferase family 4 protein [Bacteroidales bacterium]|nr:glycosyltransferase family 4 protein [Bacteroidales bacterium]